MKVLKLVRFLIEQSQADAFNKLMSCGTCLDVSGMGKAACEPRSGIGCFYRIIFGCYLPVNLII